MFERLLAKTGGRCIKKAIVGLAICLASIFFMAPPVTADVIEIEPGTILITGQLEEADFGKFLMATFYNPEVIMNKYRVALHTPGGDAFACIAIMNRIRELQRRENVTFEIHVYGKACSAGTYIFMMGDTRVIHEGATLMFHTMQAQGTEYQRANLKKDNPSFWNTIVRMDNYITATIKKITGWTDKVVDWWMNGGKAQFMSAETAYNTGFATHYIKHLN